jgi:hypothetical protein
MRPEAVINECQPHYTRNGVNTGSLPRGIVGGGYRRLPECPVPGAGDVVEIMPGMARGAA